MAFRSIPTIHADFARYSWRSHLHSKTEDRSRKLLAVALELTAASKTSVTSSSHGSHHLQQQTDKTSPQQANLLPNRISLQVSQIQQVNTSALSVPPSQHGTLKPNQAHPTPESCNVNPAQRLEAPGFPCHESHPYPSPPRNRSLDAVGYIHTYMSPYSVYPHSPTTH